jgi:uncharacterized protein (UPF0332 family)
MKPEQLELLLKARQSILAAQLLLNNSFAEYSVSRSYYAMFYITQAFLEEKGLSFSSHSAVISAFGREFAKTGRVPTKFHRQLINAQDLRNNGDYGGLNTVSIEQANEQIINAQQFLALAENHMGKLPPQDNQTMETND